MNSIAIITSLLTLLAGIGVFLIACQMMSSNLEAASSEKLKKLFSKASGSKLLGVGIGAVGTAAIQSSGATTVMTIGFVNAGIISLSQAATIIYGANIGTTVTAQIVALGMFGGNSIAVYNPLSDKKKASALKLKRQGRVAFATPAVYTRESRTFHVVCAIINKIKADDELDRLSRLSD